MKFINISDVHLADILDFDSSLSNLIRDTKWKSFEDILKNNKDVDFALISGDLYERDYFTAKNYERLFEIIENFGKDVYYVCGNHDYINSKNSIFFENIPNNLHIFSSDMMEYFEIGKARIYGISYKDRIFDKRFNYNLNLNQDFTNILIIHGQISNEKSPYLNLDLELLKNMDFNYIGIGHIHKRKKFFDNIYYVGSIEAHSFKDTGEFGYNIIDDLKVDQIDSSYLEFKEFDLDLSDYSSKEEIINFLETKFSKKYRFLKLNLNSYDKYEVSENFIKKELDLTYIEINKSKSKDYYSNLASIYKNTILEDFYNRANNLDLSDEINKRCLEIGIDAILRSKND